MIDPAALAAVPGCESGRPPDVLRKLPGGRGCNDIRYIQTPAGRFVLRTRHEPLDRPGAFARQELACHRAAARIGCAPQIVAAADDARWLLMVFVDAPLWRPSDLERISAIEDLGRRLGELHARANVSDCERLDALAVAAAQRRAILQARADLAPLAESLEREVRESVAALAEAGERRALTHGDLQLGNMLGSPPVFVDWEYAQVADPTYDIACLLTYHPGLAGKLDRLLGAAGLAQDGDRRRLACQRQLFSALNRLWMLANGLDAG